MAAADDDKFWNDPVNIDPKYRKLILFVQIVVLPLVLVIGIVLGYCFGSPK